MYEWRKKCRENWSGRNTTFCSMMKVCECPEFEKAEREEILQLLPSWKKKRVLDLAAGVGRFTKEFANDALAVTVVEWIPKFVAENKRINTSFSNIRYICADAAEVEFPRESFDLIFINWLFMYLEDEEVSALAKRIQQWLMPGGYVFFRESCEEPRRNAIDSNQTIYRSLKEYDGLFPEFILKKDGSVQAWIEYLARPLSCYWLFEKPSIKPAISGIPVLDSTKTPPLSK